MLFLNRIFEMDILVELFVLRSPETEKRIFRGWSVYLVCVTVIGITPKQIVAEVIGFHIYIICKCYLNLFMKIWQIFRDPQIIPIRY